VIYAPSSASNAAIDEALGRLRNRLAQFAGAAASRFAIC